jgi:hypothetical protein
MFPFDRPGILMPDAGICILVILCAVMLCIFIAGLAIGDDGGDEMP